jgi:hypothetical protein
MMTPPTTDNRTRKIWCDLVDHSFLVAKARGDNYTVAGILANCGIFEWSPYRKAAESYLHKLIAATSTNFNGGAA